MMSFISCKTHHPTDRTSDEGYTYGYEILSSKKMKKRLKNSGLSKKKIKEELKHYNEFSEKTYEQLLEDYKFTSPTYDGYDLDALNNILLGEFPKIEQEIPTVSSETLKGDWIKWEQNFLAKGDWTFSFSETNVKCTITFNHQYEYHVIIQKVSDRLVVDRHTIDWFDLSYDVESTEGTLKDKKTP